MAKSKIKVRHKFSYQYAVKFICTSNIPGTSQGSDGLLPGTYSTSVNIHNPHDHKVKYRKKLAAPGVISKYISNSLGGDAVNRITCSNLGDFDIVLIHGFEGFLVIESSHSIDVTAVYTAGANGSHVMSIDVEQVKERKK